MKSNSTKWFFTFAGTVTIFLLLSACPVQYNGVLFPKSPLSGTYNMDAELNAENGPYDVQGLAYFMNKLSITEGAELNLKDGSILLIEGSCIIEKGVSFSFGNDTSMSMSNNVYCVGTQSDTIKFTAKAGAERNWSIRCASSADADIDVTFGYCEIVGAESISLFRGDRDMDALIMDCVFDDCGQCICVDSKNTVGYFRPLIQNNVFANSDSAISVGLTGRSNVTLSYNVFSGCDIVLFNNNEITASMNNFEYGMQSFTNHSEYDVDAEDNYWGSAVELDIDQMIFDKNDDAQFGTVDYTPFLTEPTPLAGLE
jgi:hypothetical protein